MAGHLAGYYGPNTTRKLPVAGHYGGGFLYVVAFDLGGPSKIGITVRPRTRINELQHAAGRELMYAYLSPECTNYAALEAQIHERAKKAGYHRIGEWFNIAFWDATKAVTLNKDHFNRVNTTRRNRNLAEVAESVRPPTPEMEARAIEIEMQLGYR
jgi:hypothetical protein